jgi:hypothetical protein
MQTSWATESFPFAKSLRLIWTTQTGVEQIEVNLGICRERQGFDRSSFEEDSFVRWNVKPNATGFAYGA